MRPRGGIIGASFTPTQSAASGIWTVREAEAYTRSGAWPAFPGAPTSVTGTAGSGQVSLTWTAPSSTGGSSITDYTVQYSSDSGSSWTTFSRSASSATSATVTGLTNGSSYVFRVAAVTATGAGPYSSTSSSVTLSSSKLTIARANGTSTFSGSGTSASPYVRATSVSSTNLDALVRAAGLSTGSGANYTFTATGSGTATVTLKYNDDADNANYAGIYKNGVVQGGTFTSNSLESFTRSFSIAAGDVISFRVENTSSSFSTVSVYAT